MLKAYLRIKKHFLHPFGEQKGQSLVIFAGAIVGLLGMLGLALDLGRVYIERVTINRATDAATLSSVVELPMEENAMLRAIDYLKLNGYDIGDDVEVYVRGCATPPDGGVTQNLDERGKLGTDAVIEKTDEVTGYLYIPAQVAKTDPSKVRARFSIDTGSYRADASNKCDPAISFYGSASRIKVRGQAYVEMNFMKLPGLGGFSRVRVSEEAIAENVTSLDVMVVFDVSGSMEFQTACAGCWTKTKEWLSDQDVRNMPYPSGNGYFNPVPFNPAWFDPSGGTKSSIPDSQLCSPRNPDPENGGNPILDYEIPSKPSLVDATTDKAYYYLVHEAEFYSAKYNSNWSLQARNPGQGFWAVQRGSRNYTNVAAGFGGANPGIKIDSFDNDNFYHNRFQGNQAGFPKNQSANVCHPGIDEDSIDCTLGRGKDAGDICRNTINGYGPVDCSTYIKAAPFATYEDHAGAGLVGGTYNIDCFPPTNNCWSSGSYGTGLGKPPWVEYDFSYPDYSSEPWGETTYVWVRAIGGSDLAYQWSGNPTPLNSYQRTIDYGMWWRSALYWEVVDALNPNISLTGIVPSEQQVKPMSDNGWSATTARGARDQTWRDNRAQNSDWQWIRLGAVNGTQPLNQYTLKLYQGSAGYKIDRVVFTNDEGIFEYTNNNPTQREYTQAPYQVDPKYNGTRIYAVLNCPYSDQFLADDRTAIPSSCDTTNAEYGIGPKISRGSATREACNPLNPMYGSVDLSPTEYKCKRSANSGDRDGAGCTNVDVPTNMLADDLYGDVQPLRSAQEAIKGFIARLDPKFDQAGFLAFSTDVVSEDKSRSKLQCRNWGASVMGNADMCYASNDPISYTKVLKAVENQWARGGTDIAEGLREGLEELGVATPGNEGVDLDCTPEVNDGHSCSRGGTARRILVLMTDGSPNEFPGNPTSAGYPASLDPDNSKGTFCTTKASGIDVWDGDPNDEKYQCAMFYAYQAYNSGVTLYTIGLGGAVNGNLLTAMATGTNPETGTQYFPGRGGKFYPAASPQDLDAIFEEILGQIYVRIIG